MDAEAAPATAPAAGTSPAEITDLLADRLGIEVPTPDTDLVEAGLIDSLALVTLIVELENATGRRLPLADFDIDRFRSVDAMVDFVSAE